eukprot:scaffold136827_cov142-Phaeocystis_antarctica.AAC.1
MAAGEREFPDTYIFTVAQLHAAGLSKTVIMAKLQAFQQQLQFECQQDQQDGGQRARLALALPSGTPVDSCAISHTAQTLGKSLVGTKPSSAWRRSCATSRS